MRPLSEQLLHSPPLHPSPGHPHGPLFPISTWLSPKLSRVESGGKMVHLFWLSGLTQKRKSLLSGLIWVGFNTLTRAGLRTALLGKYRRVCVRERKWQMTEISPSVLHIFDRCLTIPVSGRCLIPLNPISRINVGFVRLCTPHVETYVASCWILCLSSGQV